MSLFGFGQQTGLELGGISGILAGPDFRLENNYAAWMPGDVLSAAIGQSDNTASPLQLACYLSTVSNGGTRYSAHLLHSVYRFGATEPLYAYTQSDDTVLDRVNIPTSVQSTIFAGMRDMIKGSSTASHNMASVPVTVGGKTGTAEVNGKDANALFIGAAPYNDPEIVVSVVLEAGRSGTNATYTAGKILEKYYALQTQ
jgi:penicillin-binding protein 2